MKEVTKSILRYNLDLEILLRLQEKKLIELELLRGNQIKETLELAIINEYKNLAPSEVKSFPVLAKRPESTNIYLNDQSPKLVTKSSQHQYEIKPDGTAVKLRCPVCLSDKFKSMLGYLNHCRIHCKVIFSSPEDRQIRGGVPVDINQVPGEIFVAKHPSLVKQEHDLAIIRSEVSSNLLDENRLPNVNEYNTDYSCIVVDNDNIAGLDDITDSNCLESLPARNLKNESCSLSNLNRFYTQKSIIIGNEAACMVSQSTVRDSSNQIATHKWKFYVRPGNYYSLKNRDMSLDEIYGEFNKLIKSIDIYLHPNYKPAKVTLFGPSYELELAGWGEFPIRTVIHFWDERRNKPLEFIHHLRIYMACQQGKLTPGPERLYTIDIDKETDFSLAKPDYRPPPKIVLESARSDQKSINKSQFEILKDHFDPSIQLTN
jgi:hypothetical protein